jgi:Holliday junction resolvase RusA-like endonuclease
MQITLPLPPSINGTYRTYNNRTYKTHLARAWENEAGWEIKGIYKPIHNSDKNLSVKLDFYFDRERDIDSGIKILLDLLQTSIYKNDKQIKELTVTKNSDKKNPRVEVQITEL